MNFLPNSSFTYEAPYWMFQPGNSATNVSSNTVKIPQLSILLSCPTSHQTLILTTAFNHFIMQPEMLAVPHTCSIVFHQCFIFIHLAFPIFPIEKFLLPFLLIHTLCVCVCVCVCVYVLVTQLCLTPCNLMECNLPGSSVHGILQARILEWVQFSSVTQSCMTLCEPMNCNMPGLHVHHQLLEFTQIHVH